MFYGLYVATESGSVRLEPYLFLKSLAAARATDGRQRTLDVYTAGLRAERQMARAWSWEMELAFQRGRAAGEAVRAFGGVWQICWRPGNAPLRPSITAAYSHASGDRRPADGIHGTFDTPYPTTHLRNGATDRLGWAHLHDALLQADWSLRRRARLFAAFHNFSMASLRDTLYSPGGAVLVRRPDSPSRHVGWELSGTVEYRFSSSMSLGAGCAHLFPGEYLRRAGRAGATQPFVFVAYRF